MEILLIDDHKLFRTGLRLMLAELAPDVVIHEAGSVEAALALGLDEHAIQLILLDLNLPGLSGLDAVRLVRRRLASSPLVLLSGVDDPAVLQAAGELGARGFIAKSSSAQDMLADIRHVLAGGACWVRPPHDQALQIRGEALHPSGMHLTGRQIDVLTALCRGASNKEIARRLGMSDNTVSTHMAAIFRELGVRSRSEAIITARNKGLL